MILIHFKYNLKPIYYILFYILLTHRHKYGGKGGVG